MNTLHVKPLYVGAMNDALFIIDAPPRPSNDDVNPNQNVRVIAKVNEELGHEAVRAFSSLFAAAPEMFASLKATVEIVADELENIIECHTLKGDRSTLDEAARPDVERFERVLAEARAIIAKAEGRA